MSCRARRAVCAGWILACATSVPAGARAPVAACLDASVERPASTSVTNSGAEDRRTRAERLQEALELDLVPAAAPLARAVAADSAASAREKALAARVLAAGGARDEASRLCAGDGLDARLARARIALELDDDGALLRRALAAQDGGARDAASAEAWLLLGRERGRAGDWPLAERCLARGLELDRHHADAPAARVLLAKAAEARGDEAEARRRAVQAQQCAQWHALLKARRLQVLRRPAEALPRIGLAELWLAVDEPARALEPLDAWSPEPAQEDARLAALAGECLRRLGRTDLAHRRLQRATELAPELVETRYFRALLALDEGRPDDAQAELERVCADPAAVDGRLLRAHLLLARLHAQAGRKEAAAARYEQYAKHGGTEPLAAGGAR